MSNEVSHFRLSIVLVAGSWQHKAMTAIARGASLHVSTCVMRVVDPASFGGTHKTKAVHQLP
jgi:hypothetical protein